MTRLHIGSTRIWLDCIMKKDQLVIAVAPDGSEKIMKKLIVDRKQAVFLLSGSAIVELAEYTNHFDDVLSDAWYLSAVNFAAERELSTDLFNIVF